MSILKRLSRVVKSHVPLQVLDAASKTMASGGDGSRALGVHPELSRQFDREDASLAGQIAHTNFTAVQLHGFAADGESEPQPRAIAAALVEGTKKRLGSSRR